MSLQRFIVLLIAALAAISGALYVSMQRNLTKDPGGMALLPTVAGELDTVSELRVLKGSATPTVTIHKQGERWTVAERADYPADVPKLRKLLLALGEAKIREQKTSNPASFSTIGVEDPLLPGAAGAQLELVAKDGKHGVVVGKPVGAGSFVRRAGENTSYIVEPGISFEAEPRYWIDTQLLDISAANIQSIDVKPNAGPAYSVHRVAASNAPPGTAAAGSPPTGTPPAGNNFALNGVPNGRKAADPQILAPSPTTFSSLSAEDVSRAADIDFSMPSVVTVTMSDGNVVTLTGAVIGDKRWIEVAATKDAALSAKTAGRAFAIATYRYDGIFRPLEQLLVPKAPAPAAKKADREAKTPHAAPAP
jgi:hypothetical protein